jgi:cysteinyl-tRNA synthetase
MELRLQDSLTGRPGPVRPSRDGVVRMYVCGPTVYDAAHVGHGSNYLYFDVARRFLEAEGLRVRHVMNITDLEDKIDRRAAERGLTWKALARGEERGFRRDLDALGILPPHRCPRASEHVPEMVRLARALARTGRVHAAGEEWVYEAPRRRRGENFATAEELSLHAVPEPRHPFPVSGGGERSLQVWKRQGPPRPSFDGPWGRGVPGWHLECVALARRFLGIPVDLHGGGRDLVYPHHFGENEITLALEGERFARRFFHTGFVLQAGLKISKSLGNMVLLRPALRSFGRDGLRRYLLSRPPASRLEWSDAEAERSADLHRATRRAIADWLAPGAGGRWGAARVRALSEGVRRDLADGLRTDRAFERLREFTEALERDPSGRVARGEGPAARAFFRTVEARTGLALV